MHKRGLCRHAVSVRLSAVCLSRSWIMSKRINESSNGEKILVLTILVFPYQTGWRKTGSPPPNGGVECRWGRQKNEILVDPYRALLDICILVLTDFRFRHTMLPSAYAKLVKENNEEVVVIDSEDTDIYVQAAYVSHKPQGNLLIKRKNEYISCSAMLSEDVA